MYLNSSPVLYSDPIENSVDMMEWKWVMFIDCCVSQVYRYTKKYISSDNTEQNALLEDCEEWVGKKKYREHEWSVH
jgi:hypothetical protein